MREYCKKAEKKVEFRSEIVIEDTTYQKNCIPNKDNDSPVNELLEMLIENKCLIIQDDWTLCAKALTADIMQPTIPQLATKLTLDDVITTIKCQLLLR